MEDNENVTAGAGAEAATAGEENHTTAPEPAENGSILGSEPTGAPENYDFTSIVPEGMEFDEKAAGEFGAIAKELNLTQEQANKLASYGMNWMQGNVNAVNDAIRQKVTGWADETKKALGGEYNDTVAKAVSVADAVERQVPGFKKMLNETGAGNRVELIKVMAAFSQFVRQDDGHGGAAASGSQPASVYGKTDFSKY